MRRNVLDQSLQTGTGDRLRQCAPDTIHKTLPLALWHRQMPRMSKNPPASKSEIGAIVPLRRGAYSSSRSGQTMIDRIHRRKNKSLLRLRSIPIDRHWRLDFSVGWAGIVAVILLEVRNPYLPVEHRHMPMGVPLDRLNDGDVTCFEKRHIRRKRCEADC